MVAISMSNLYNIANSALTLATTTASNIGSASFTWRNKWYNV